jgi:hypothetical protein
MDQGTDVNLK